MFSLFSNCWYVVVDCIAGQVLFVLSLLVIVVVCYVLGLGCFLFVSLSIYFFSSSFFMIVGLFV